jgi:dolichol-phosphate mannosyltransferase
MPKSITLIVPTYKEAANIPLLLSRVAKVAAGEDWQPELLFMDDDSRDGSGAAVANAGLPWAKLVTRTTDRGLSAAVLDGFRRATGDYLVCLDADLSHPPERIPEMIRALDDGADFALGSRYIQGGSTDDDWGLFRWLNSRVATWLARPLTHVKDPMSGFFAMRREQFVAGRDFNPIGYKIGLELLVKCNCRKPVEIPIHFADRQLGESKLTFREQLRYIQHVRRLFIFRYGTWSHLIQFLVVGALGTIVNLAALSIALRLGVNKQFSILAGIGVSFLFNFVLNRRFTFSYARDRSIVRQFMGFTSASVVGAVINYLVAVYLSVPHGPIRSTQLAAVIGIIAGAGLNFVFNRYFVFRYQHYKPKGETK